MMEGTIEIKTTSKHTISVLGKEYYEEGYVEEMMEREYQRGLQNGQQQPIVHIAQIEECSNCSLKKSG